MVVDFRLGRLQNIAPAHKSELRNCVDLFFGLGSSRGAFLMLLGRLLGSFGTPWEALGVTLGHLGVTWDPLGLLWGAPGCFWDSILLDFDVFLTLWVQKFVQDAKKYDF